jgi:hypothetical protein
LWSGGDTANNKSPGLVAEAFATDELTHRSGVADGTRTRDSQDHNLVLYQLNYSHHCRRPVTA